MEIDKIASLQLQPDDILVLNYQGKCSDKLYEHLKATLERIAPGHKALILEQGMTLQVLKPVLKWTSDLPTQEGWYWWKMFNGTVKECVEVSLSSAGQLVVDDGDEVISLPTYGGEWYGPIEPPEYP